MQDNNKNKKDMFDRIKDFPEVQPSADFLERVHEKIENLKNENEPSKLKEKENTILEKPKKYFGKNGLRYLIPGFAISLAALLIYIFAFRDESGSGNELISKKLPMNVILPELISANDLILLDSMISEQKKIIDKTSKDGESAIRMLAEKNGKNFNKILAGIYNIDLLNPDTMSSKDFLKEGSGSEMDRMLRIKIEQLDGEAVGNVIEALKVLRR